MPGSVRFRACRSLSAIRIAGFDFVGEWDRNDPDLGWKPYRRSPVVVQRATEGFEQRVAADSQTLFSHGEKPTVERPLAKQACVRVSPGRSRSCCRSPGLSTSTRCRGVAELARFSGGLAAARCGLKAVVAKAQRGTDSRGGERRRWFRVRRRRGRARSFRELARESDRVRWLESAEYRRE
jgi:hypothetical protein